MSAGKIKAGEAYVEASLRATQFERDLARMGKRLKDWGANVVAVGQRVALAGAAGIGGFAAAAISFSNVGDAAAKGAKRIGTTAEAYQELAHAADLSGTSIGSLEAGLQASTRLLSNVKPGTGLDLVLREIGLSAEELIAADPAARLGMVADALNGISQPGTRAAVAMQIFGRSAGGLLPLLAEGSAGINAMRQEARDLGVVLSNDGAKEAEVLNDAIGRLRSQLKSVAVNIGGALAPELIRLSASLSQTLAQAIRWITENRGLIVSLSKVTVVVTAVGAAIVTAGVAMIGIGSTLRGLATIVGLASKAFGLLTAAMSGVAVSPLLTGAAIVAGTAAILHYTGATRDLERQVGATWTAIRGDVTEAVGGISQAFLAGDIEAAAGIAMAGVRLVFAEVIASIKIMWAELVANIKYSLGIIPTLIKQAQEQASGFLAGLLTGNDPIVQASTDAGIQTIEDERAARLAVIEDEARARRNAARAEVEHAKAALRERIAGIRQLSPLEAAAVAVPAAQRRTLAAGQATEALAKLTSSGGILSGFAAGRAGSTGNFAERAAKATEETADNTSAILQALRNQTGMAAEVFE